VAAPEKVHARPSKWVPPNPIRAFATPIRGRPALTRGRPAPVLCILLLILTLAACAAPQPHTAPPDRTGWHVLYERPDWDGGSSVDLRAVGDVMLGRGVAAAAERNGIAYLFSAVGDLLAGDLAVGNLESPLTHRRADIRPGPYRLIAPPALAPALPNAGFTALALANNHALDAGAAGLAASDRTLERVGIAALGVGATQSDAYAPHIRAHNGQRIAMLAFNDVIDPADGAATLAPIGAAPGGWISPDAAVCVAGDCGYQRAWLGPEALEAVQRARENADIVVVMAHWGVEYAATPSARQRAWAERLVAAGADLVLGAHPHVLQPAEALHVGGRSGFVAYSLGNFVFDGPADPQRNSGAVLRVLFDSAGIALVMVAPVNPTGGRPEPLELDSAAVHAALQALGVAMPAAPEPQPAPAATTTAWRWNGATAEPTILPNTLTPAAAPTRLPVDLRGNGESVWAELDALGSVTVRDGPEADAPLLWQNEDPAWRFTRIAAGDPNDDGRAELILLLWQADEEGTLRSQPYLLGWRGGRFQIIWGGSATATPIQDLAVGDLNGDGRSELVVLEGGSAPGDPGDSVSVWTWHGWGFQREWTSEPGVWHSIHLIEANNTGERIIVATP
jgi:poly-gamma-glutamate capsule biosynthesis protein CapA/YwtB (metallophosphatase superfamily)